MDVDPIHTPAHRRPSLAWAVLRAGKMVVIAWASFDTVRIAHRTGTDVMAVGVAAVARSTGRSVEQMSDMSDTAVVLAFPLAQCARMTGTRTAPWPVTTQATSSGAVGTR
jgi:hypothetical protein